MVFLGKFCAAGFCSAFYRAREEEEEVVLVVVGGGFRYGYGFVRAFSRVQSIVRYSKSRILGNSKDR